MSSIIDEVKFDQNGLVPVVVQDCKTYEVLMLAYMNREALQKSIETKKAYYWSRSRNKLWLKGETSGHFQKIKSMKIDCDNDTLLISVEQIGGACHTGHHSCFYRELGEGEAKTTQDKVFEPEKVYGANAKILQDLYDVIADRTINPKEGSYTNYLLDSGIDKILKKVGEECAEVLIAAKNNSKEEIRYEISDLVYHILVLMVKQGLKLEDIYDELKRRR